MRCTPYSFLFIKKALPLYLYFIFFILLRHSYLCRWLPQLIYFANYWQYLASPTVVCIKRWNLSVPWASIWSTIYLHSTMCTMRYNSEKVTLMIVDTLWNLDDLLWANKQFCGERILKWDVILCQWSLLIKTIIMNKIVLVGIVLCWR